MKWFSLCHVYFSTVHHPFPTGCHASAQVLDCARRLLHLLHARAEQSLTLLDHEEILRARVTLLQRHIANPPDVQKFETVRQEAVRLKRAITRTKLDMDDATEDGDATTLNAATLVRVALRSIMLRVSVFPLWCLHCEFLWINGVSRLACLARHCLISTMEYTGGISD